MAAKGQYKTDEEKQMWLSIINSALMSSDSSGEDDGEEVIIVHPLPWISADVTAFKKKLDDQIAQEKSPQARRQMKRRVSGPFSRRSCPANLVYPLGPLWIDCRKLIRT